jgi:hypothetical protein
MVKRILAKHTCFDDHHQQFLIQYRFKVPELQVLAPLLQHY